MLKRLPGEVTPLTWGEQRTGLMNEPPILSDPRWGVKISFQKFTLTIFHDSRELQNLLLLSLLFMLQNTHCHCACHVMIMLLTICLLHACMHPIGFSDRLPEPKLRSKNHSLISFFMYHIMMWISFVRYLVKDGYLRQSLQDGWFILNEISLIVLPSDGKQIQSLF